MCLKQSKGLMIMARNTPRSKSNVGVFAVGVLNSGAVQASCDGVGSIGKSEVCEGFLCSIARFTSRFFLGSLGGAYAQLAFGAIHFFGYVS